jgi:antitoxin CptB
MVSPQKKAKLTWHCRRGMLELDLILQRFLAHQLDMLTDSQVELFERLLTAQDPDLYAWLMGYEAPVDKELRDIVTFIQLHDNVR